jgi:adenylate cyclase class IV
MTKETVYEVETRVYFKSFEEAFKKLPFLKKDLTRKLDWTTETYGSELFKTDILLRASEVISEGTKKYYLGYKEKDLGGFCNIRAELDEEITEEMKVSTTLKALTGKDISVNIDTINSALSDHGYEKFMSFSGDNVTGTNQELGLALKLMHCETLEFPVLLELEKSAYTYEEALKAEGDIKSILETLDLLDRVVRKEPPTLLFEVTQ